MLLTQENAHCVAQQAGALPGGPGQLLVVWVWRRFRVAGTCGCDRSADTSAVTPVVLRPEQVVGLARCGTTCSSVKCAQERRQVPTLLTSGGRADHLYHLLIFSRFQFLAPNRSHADRRQNGSKQAKGKMGRCTDRRTDGWMRERLKSY